MTLQERIESLFSTSASLRAQLNELSALRDQINRAEGLAEGEEVKPSYERHHPRHEQMHTGVG